MVLRIMNKNLKTVLKFIGVVFLLGLFGYIGYIYSKDNNKAPFNGIIFGMITPLVIGGINWLISEFNFSNIGQFIGVALSFALWIYIIEIIPNWIGIIVLIAIIVLIVFGLIEELEENKEKSNIKKNTNETVFINNRLINHEQLEFEVANDEDENDAEEEFYCERCFKKISEEEYEANDCMCEDCFSDTHMDEFGNFRDDF